MSDPGTGARQPAAELRELREELERTRQALRDATERLRVVQAHLVQAGTLSALGQLVASIAHEMNNPLTSVIGYAQLVHQQLVRRPDVALDTQELVSDVGHILAEASRTARIVRNLLMFARRQTVVRAYQDIEFLCDQVVELRSYDFKLNNIAITTSFAPHLPAVLADASQVQQVLLNLLLNAERAVLGGAERRIALEVTAEPDCGAVRIEVRDSGEGVPADRLGRVFDPFFTTRPAPDGTGLGLTIAQSIVRDHGGEIWADSEPGVRTSFYVRLPASEDQTEPGSSGTAVVIHEDAGRQTAIAAALAGWGFQAGTAARVGDEADAVPPTIVVAQARAIRADPAGWERLSTRDGAPGRLILIEDAAAGAVPADLAATGGTRRRWTVTPVSEVCGLCELRRAVVTALGPRLAGRLK